MYRQTRQQHFVLPLSYTEKKRDYKVTVKKSGPFGNTKKKYISNNNESSENPMSRISITGFSRFSKVNSRCRKLFWAVAILSAFTLFLLHSGLRVWKFLYDDPSIKIYYTENSTVLYPSITICPDVIPLNPAFNYNLLHNNPNEVNKKFTDVYNYIRENVTDVEAFWTNELDKHIANFTGVMIEGHSFGTSYFINENVIKTTIISPTGRCLSFSAGRRDNDKGEYKYVKIEIEHVNGITDDRIVVFIHQEEASYLARYFTSIRGRHMTFGRKLIMRDKVVENIRLNTSKSPCEDTQTVSKCIEDCIERLLYKNLSQYQDFVCRLPFTRPRNDIVPCKSNEIETVYKRAETFFLGFKTEQCNCPRQCHEISHSNRFVNFNKYFKNVTTIQYELDLEMTVIQEYWDYSPDALLSHIGGSVGLFLGVCLLTIVEIFEVIFYNISNLIKK